MHLSYPTFQTTEKEEHSRQRRFFQCFQAWHSFHYAQPARYMSDDSRIIPPVFPGLNLAVFIITDTPPDEFCYFTHKIPPSLGIQMMFSFMLVDDAKPLRQCKHCQKVFLGSRANSAFCSARCKNQYNVYKSRGKNTGQDGENDD